MRLRLRNLGALTLVAALALTASCGGGSSATPTPTVPAGGIPTATPFATVPPALIVTATVGGSGPETSYTVQAGDSLLAIASRFGTTVEAIEARNNLTGSDIFVGQDLVIPAAGAAGSGSPADTGGAAGPATPTATATASAGGGSTRVYVVKSGDTALAIAGQFHTTLEALAAANGMTVDDLNNLHEGQQLQVPTS